MTSKTFPILVDETTIAGHWLPALINGDYTGLSDAEETELDSWWTKYCDGAVLTIGDVSDESEFAIDRVSGLMADCYAIKVFEL